MCTQSRGCLQECWRSGYTWPQGCGAFSNSSRWIQSCDCNCLPCPSSLVRWQDWKSSLCMTALKAAWKPVCYVRLTWTLYMCAIYTTGRLCPDPSTLPDRPGYWQRPLTDSKTVRAKIVFLQPLTDADIFGRVRHFTCLVQCSLAC